MKKIPLSLIAIFILASELAVARTLTLQVGNQSVIKARATGTITVSSPKTIKVIQNHDELHIIARQSGTAQILVGSSLSIEVIVFTSKVGDARREILFWLKNIYGISLETRPDKIILRGTALRLQDWTMLQVLKNRYSKIISVDVKPSPSLISKIDNSVRGELRSRSINASRAAIRNGQLTIMTSETEKNDSAVTDEIINEWGLKKISMGSNVELKPMVEVEILIAEVKKNSFRSFGLKSPSSYSATILPTGDLSSAAITFNPFTPEFHALLSRDSGRILASPKIICRSGSAAHFVAGGEIPIKIISWKNSDVVWKRYGVILDITPTADFNEGISTKIVTEVSLIDEAHKIDGIPGFLTNRIETHFDLRGTKTIALSGLIKSETGRNSSGIPLLGEIPILGDLFKSRDYRDNKTELVVFVTPRLISPEQPPEPPPVPLWNEDE